MNGPLGDGVDTAPDERFVGATDAHVHLMPDRLVAAIRGALNEETGWSFTHPTTQAAMESFLRDQGVTRYLALPYAHKPGMACELNGWLLDRAAGSDMCVPFATVHPADDVRTTVARAFEGGARGLKFQCPVQGAAPDDPRLDPAFELASEHDRPVLFHAGTAPLYEDSSYVGHGAFESFLASFPDVRGCCAHMGTFDWEAFVDLLTVYDNAFLDTCFAMSTAVGESMAFSPGVIPDDVFERHAERIMYGSDFPNIPHSYISERAGLLARDLPVAVYDDLFRRSVRRFLGEPVD